HEMLLHKLICSSNVRMTPRQLAIVRSSNPKARTIACTGQPHENLVTTTTITSVGLRSPANSVPCLALHVFPQVLHRYGSATTMDDDSPLPDLPCTPGWDKIPARHSSLCGFFHRHSLQMNPQFSSPLGFLSTS